MCDALELRVLLSVYIVNDNSLRIFMTSRYLFLTQLSLSDIEHSNFLGKKKVKIFSE